MTDDLREYFRILELKPGASAEEAKQAYREMAKAWQPDRFQDDPGLLGKARERLREIDNAYDRLQDYFRAHRELDGSSQTTGEDRAESREVRGGDDAPPILPPPLPRPPESTGTGEEKKSHAGVIWGVVVVVGIIAVLIIAGSSGGSGNSTPSYGVSGGGGAAGGGGYTPAPAYVAPVSKALDEKNGFKDFHFGMTPGEARAVLEPTQDTRNPGANEEVFYYLGTPANRIGEFATDAPGLRFFEGKLYRIDIGFTNFGNEIFEALKISYGEAGTGVGWKRDEQALTARSWEGENVSAAILAPTGQAWDALVVFDKAANRKAEEFASNEPERAARDFSATEFKSLSMGMRLEDVATPYTVDEESQVTGVKELVFSGSDLLAVGFYPLRHVSAEFFKGRLYKIDFGFEQNRKEMFQAFQHQFGPLQDNTTWTRGTEKLTAKCGGGEKLYGTILAPGGAYGGEAWDAIVLLDPVVWREAEQYKQDGPKRAAKDL